MLSSLYFNYTVISGLDRANIVVFYFRVDSKVFIDNSIRKPPQDMLD